jgi:hypothetical protein
MTTGSLVQPGLHGRVASAGNLLLFDVSSMLRPACENYNLSGTIDLKAMNVEPSILRGLDSFRDIGLLEDLDTARHLKPLAVYGT